MSKDAAIVMKLTRLVCWQLKNEKCYSCVKCGRYSSIKKRSVVSVYIAFISRFGCFVWEELHLSEERLAGQALSNNLCHQILFALLLDCHIRWLAWHIGLHTRSLQFVPLLLRYLPLLLE